MSKCADLANLIGNINAGGGGVNRNVIINGAMNVAQRGTSYASVANNAYTLDRFAFTYSQDGAFTVTQDSSAPDGFANSLKLDVTTADSSLAASQYLIMEHKIEAQNLQHLHFGKSSAKNITLSFYVKSNKTGTYGVSIIQSDNSSKIANLTYTINSADTWEEKSLTFTGDTSGVINDDNGIGLKVGFTLAVGSTWTSGDTSASFRTFVNGNYGGGQTVNILDSTSNEWFITGVQLEVGQNPTSFEHEPFDRTLVKCQRYFENVASYGGSGTPTQSYWQGILTHQYTTSRMFGRFIYKVIKRATPTVTVHNHEFAFASHTDSRTLSNNPQNTYADISGVGLDFQNQGTNYTGGESGHVDLAGTCYITSDAEL